MKNELDYVYRNVMTLRPDLAYKAPELSVTQSILCGLKDLAEIIDDLEARIKKLEERENANH